MITIYHLDTSRSERIVWLMEELGLGYELEVFDRRPDIFAPDELKAIHPLGRAPVIRDGDTVLAESGAIVEYIIARHGGGRLAIAPSEPGFRPIPVLAALRRGQPHAATATGMVAGTDAA